MKYIYLLVLEAASRSLPVLVTIYCNQQNRPELVLKIAMDAHSHHLPL
jgi:hypothetical protein